jgi:hypothetical protein
MIKNGRGDSDDTTVPVLAKGKTDIGRCLGYVRDARPFGGPDPPAAMFYYSRDRVGKQSLGREDASLEPSEERRHDGQPPRRTGSLARARPAIRSRQPRRRDRGGHRGAARAARTAMPSRDNRPQRAGELVAAQAVDDAGRSELRGCALGP